MDVMVEHLAQLNDPLDESHLCDVHVDIDRRTIRIGFDVWALREDDSWPEDPRVFLFLHPVGRVAASLRMGSWNDAQAAVVPFNLKELPSIVESFEGQSIYGASFFDRGEEELGRWGDRLSFDYQEGSGGKSHSIVLFQEGNNRHLDFCVWFDELEIRDPHAKELAVDEVVAGYTRWCAALARGDAQAKVKTTPDGRPYSWFIPGAAE